MALSTITRPLVKNYVFGWTPFLQAILLKIRNYEGARKASSPFTDKHRKELEENGMTVVPRVISSEDCDRHQAYFREWLGTFPKGTFPYCLNSLIQQYKTGHMRPSWEVRLAAKSVFAKVWGTEKLLSSMDAIAIGRPPEEGQEAFWAKGQSWLHVDQSADRKGLHAFQGAVYLETCEEDDWTFEIIQGSHLLFDEFMIKTNQWTCKQLLPEDVEWFKGRGCHISRVPCPKGGMVLWDSRLFHANARPLQRRSNPGRWRYVVFVCMTPASWATPEDIAIKVDAYDKMYLTHHWPSQEIFIFPSVVPDENQAYGEDIVTELPEVARSEKARKLVGMLPYRDDDGDVVICGGGEADTGAWANRLPVWDRESWVSAKEEYLSKNPTIDFKLTPKTT